MDTSTKRRAQILLLAVIVIIINFPLLANLNSFSTLLVLHLQESNHLMHHHRRRHLFGFPLFSDPKTVELRTYATPVILSDSSSPVELFSSHDAVICEVGIDRLIEAIKTDLDKFSLRPIHFSVGDDEFYFGGLDMNMIHRVFLGNKIAIFGDSTLRNLLTWLRFLLLLTVQSHSLLAKGGLSTKDLSNAVYEIKKIE